MAIEIPGLRIDQSAGNTGVSQLTQTVSAASEIGANVDVMGQVKLRKETRDADAYVSQKSTELILESQELFTQVVNETEDPNQITDTFMGRYNDLYANKVEDAPNAIARRNLELKSNQLRASMGKAAIGVQADEVQAKRLNGLQNSVDQAIISTRNSGNLALGSLAIDEALSGAESYTRPSELQELRDQANAQLKGAYLDRQFESGNLGEVRRAINDEEFNKDLSPKQVDAYRKDIKREQERITKANELSDSVKFLTTGEGGLNGARVYDYKDDKKVVNAMFNNVGYADMFIGAGIEPLGTEENPRVVDLVRSLDERGIQASAQLARATGVVPDDLKSFMRGALVSQNSEARAYASELLDEMELTAGDALKQAGFTDTQLLEAREYNRLKAQGMPVNDIQERLRTEFNPTSGALFDQRKAEIKNGDVKPSDSVVQVFGGFDAFTGIRDPNLPVTPEAASAIENEYQTIWNDYYIMTGDEGAADKRAAEVMKKLYYRSDVTNRDTLMRNAPEVAAGIPYYITEDGNDNHVWQRSQLLDAAKKATGRAELDIDEVFITSDATTEKAVRNGVDPSYNVMVNDKDGEPTMVGRFVFDKKKAAAEFQSKTLKERERKSRMREAQEQLPTPAGAAADLFGGF